MLYWVSGPSRDQAISYSGVCYNDKIIAPIVFAKEYMGVLDLTSEQLRENAKQCELGAGGRTVYSVFPAAGKVTYRIGSLPFVSEQTNCTIVDADNWSCRYADGSGGFGFLDGFPSVFEEDAGHTFYLRRWQYHLLRWVGPMQSALLIPDQQAQVFD
jgi:hypothetical protein